MLAVRLSSHADSHTRWRVWPVPPLPQSCAREPHGPLRFRRSTLTSDREPVPPPPPASAPERSADSCIGSSACPVLSPHDEKTGTGSGSGSGSGFGSKAEEPFFGLSSTRSPRRRTTKRRGIRLKEYPGRRILRRAASDFRDPGGLRASASGLSMFQQPLWIGAAWTRRGSWRRRVELADGLPLRSSKCWTIRTSRIASVRAAIVD
jgi:hypothetical protein